VIDCSGADTGTRWRKRVEQRETARELRDWWDDDWDCPEDQLYDHH
jgi:hypothetical protein